VLAILTVREPKREVIVGDHGPAKPSSIAAVVGLLRERSVLRYLVLAGAFSIGGQAACSAFMAPFFIRVHGLSIEQTGTMLALTYGVGGMIGMPLGGIISDAIHKRFPGRELAFFGWVNVLAAMIAAAAFLVPSWHVAMALIGIYAVSVVFYYAVIFATFMNETPGHLRAGAGATMLLAMNLFGYGLAPQFTGMVSDLSQSLGLADPLRFAQVCSGSLLMIGGLFLILAGREILRARASSTSQPSSASALAND
jgi:MFS family permease